MPGEGKKKKREKKKKETGHRKKDIFQQEWNRCIRTLFLRQLKRDYREEKRREKKRREEKRRKEKSTKEARYAVRKEAWYVLKFPSDIPVSKITPRLPFGPCKKVRPVH